MASRAKRRAFVLYLVTMGVAVAAVAWGVYYLKEFPNRPASTETALVSFEIKPAMSFNKIVTRLQSQGLIKNAPAFRFYVHWLGAAPKIRAGIYRLSPNMTPRQLVEIMIHGVQAPQISVLIPEGKHMLEVADILAAAGAADRTKLVDAMRDPLFLRQLNIEGDSIEGYLFPDTYKFRANTPARDVLKKLYQRHSQVYAQLIAKYPAQVKWLRKTLGWGHTEIVTLASIVEKETGQKDERPLIASVFFNRLTFASFQPKLLQTDPTIIYGCTVADEKSSACQKFEGRIRRIHLDDAQNPYNTYRHTGLPPGPIANPGSKAIEAVLSPQKSRYLFFVSKNDGTHYFSATQAEHEAMVTKYQRGGQSQ